MEPLILLGLGAALCGLVYKAGKREGSKKGFHVGLKKASQPKRRLRKK